MDLGSLGNPVEDVAVYPTLLSWSLTSWACTAGSRRNLYRHVVIRSKRGWTRFLESFAQWPHLQNRVYALSITLEEASYLPLILPLRKMTALRSLDLAMDWTLYPPLYFRTLRNCNGIARLHLSKSTFHRISDLRAVLEGFPHSEDLILDNIKFTRSLSDDQAHPSNLSVTRKPWAIHSCQSIRMEVSDLRYFPNPTPELSSRRVSVRPCKC